MKIYFLCSLFSSGLWLNHYNTRVRFAFMVLEGKPPAPVPRVNQVVFVVFSSFQLPVPTDEMYSHVMMLLPPCFVVWAMRLRCYYHRTTCNVAFACWVLVSILLQYYHTLVVSLIFSLAHFKLDFSWFSFNLPPSQPLFMKAKFVEYIFSCSILAFWNIRSWDVVSIIQA